MFRPRDRILCLFDIGDRLFVPIGLAAEDREIEVGDSDFFHLMTGLFSGFTICAGESVSVMLRVGLRMPLDDHDAPGHGDHATRTATTKVEPSPMSPVGSHHPALHPLQESFHLCFYR